MMDKLEKKMDLQQNNHENHISSSDTKFLKQIYIKYHKNTETRSRHIGKGECVN